MMPALFEAILADDRQQVAELLQAHPALATGGAPVAKLYDAGIFHWLYVGDTALHLAAGGYRVEIGHLLLAAGAGPNCASPHRRARPLHYATDGSPNCPTWDAERQVMMIELLLQAGADLLAQDKNGAAPLHRAVRTRCAAAVARLLQAGADPTQRNLPGSTPFHLAVQDTGRGGSGTPAARAAQADIIRLFLAHGVSPALVDARGTSVLAAARADWVRQVLLG